MYIFFQLLEKYRLMNSLPATDYGGTGRFVQISVNMNVFTDSSDNFPATWNSFLHLRVSSMAKPLMIYSLSI
jgi:hypothetical protein